MCTIGCLVRPGRVLTFKQCDLPYRAHFIEPEVMGAPTGFARFALVRDGAPGPWAGVNEHGVAFVAADAYLDEASRRDLDPVQSPMEGYAQILRDYASAGEAVGAMIAFYEESGAPDILLVSDADEAFLVEYTPHGGARVLPCSEGHLLSTNHVRMLPGAVPFEDDPSTYLRLARAEAILDDDPSFGGVMRLLSDQAHGPTERSICRVAEAEGEYFTQASVVFLVEGGRVDRATRGRGVATHVDCLYLLHHNPRSGAFTERLDVFGEASD